jgi:hypothetical protein
MEEHYPNACADHDGPEDPGDLRKGLEVAEQHGQPAGIVSGANLYSSLGILQYSSFFRQLD